MTGTKFDSFRKSWSFPDQIASLMQQVKYSNVNPLSFRILIGISRAVALFVDHALTSFVVYTISRWKENLV